MILNYIWKQTSKYTKKFLRKKQAKGLVPPDKVYFKVTVIKTFGIWREDKKRNGSKERIQKHTNACNGEWNITGLICRPVEGSSKKSWLHEEVKLSLYLKKQTPSLHARVCTHQNLKYEGHDLKTLIDEKNKELSITSPERKISYTRCKITLKKDRSNVTTVQWRIFAYKKKPQGEKIQVGQEHDSRGILSGHPLFCTAVVTHMWLLSNKNVTRMNWDLP